MVFLRLQKIFPSKFLGYRAVGYLPARRYGHGATLREGFSVPKCTTGQTGQLSSLQAVILSITGALSKMSAAPLFFFADDV